MIKVGDKVVCIKDYSYKHSDTLTNSYKSGKLYEILKIYENINGVYISADLSSEEYHYVGVWFSMKSNKYTDFDDFDDYFLTIAEWRDKQINSILDDE